MPRSIAVTFDYRCPFAYNGNAAVVNAVRGGADLAVTYMAFSLDQVHVEEGAPPVWEREPAAWGTGVLALLYGITVRDRFPEHFADAHLALFAARHDKGLQVEKEGVVRDAIASAGLDPDAVAGEVSTGAALKTLAAEHTEAVERWGVFGVPTFIEGEDAAFIRFMGRGNVADLERALDLLPLADLNEFKRPRVPR